MQSDRKTPGRCQQTGLFCSTLGQQWQQTLFRLCKMNTKVEVYKVYISIYSHSRDIFVKLRANEHRRPVCRLRGDGGGVCVTVLSHRSCFQLSARTEPARFSVGLKALPEPIGPHTGEGRMSPGRCIFVHKTQDFKSYLKVHCVIFSPN